MSQILFMQYKSDSLEIRFVMKTFGFLQQKNIPHKLYGDL